MSKISSIPSFRRKTLVSAILGASVVFTHSAYAERALEEVIVTAQKKDDTLQTVPMTVSAVTADTIAKYNLLDFKDIQSVTPGLTIKAMDTRTSTIALRGVNVLTDTGYGPGVAIYWNEVNYDIDSAFKSMYDIGQIEVLRGPQGTLRGITAPAGAVTLTTKQPSFSEVEGTVEQSLGERDLSNTQFGVSLPIIENRLALRIAGLYDHNRNEGIENVVTGLENTAQTGSGRITLGLRVTDDLEATLVHQYMEANSSGNSSVYGCGVSGCFDKFDRKSVDETRDNYFTRKVDTSLHIDWSLDGYEFVSVTGYRDQGMNTLRTSDIGNAFPAVGIVGPIPTLEQHTETNIHTLTQELRLSTSDASFYNWTYGLYGSKLVANTDVHQFNALELAPGILDAWPVHTPVVNSSEEYAVFTNQSFQWTDALESQIGLRYQSKRNTTALHGELLPSPFFAAYGVPARIGIDFPAEGQATAVDEGVTGSASISYQLTDDVRIYTSYGRSFRSGGFTVAPTADSSLAEYQPETSDSIEVGFTSRLADGRVQVNGDIYYQKYHDFLANAATVHSYNPQTGQISDDQVNYNADALVTGAELQIDALITDDWQVGLGVSYTDAKFTGGEQPYSRYDATGVFINPAPDVVFMREASGRLAGEPNWGVSANTEYTLHFGPVDGFTRVLYSFQSGRPDDTVADSVLDTSSYGIFNLYLGVRDPQKVWEITAWAKNLFDHEQVIKGALEAQTAGFLSGYQAPQLLPERQIGVTAKYNFSI
ncbi:MAG TPA: TonB-dependent receptor [Spongiibacteraceae bacterium]|nr:TonB-dependent receptor [Spongiibacteraceae bacterium]